MEIFLKRDDHFIRGTVELPYSKSILNRYLILAAMSGQIYSLEHELLADDTALLLELLSDNTREEYDCHNAGTVYRFLTAYLALLPGTQILDGSERMRKRPIGPLVEALKDIGADIQYLQDPGFPPLKIGAVGDVPPLKTIRMEPGMSSQFYTALLLIAPHWPGGLQLELPHEMVSATYFDMSLSVLKDAGIEFYKKGKLIHIPEQKIAGISLPKVRDWSSAAFFFVLAALSDKVELYFPGLQKDGIQGDEAICDITRRWGVVYTQEKDGIRIRKESCTLPPTLSIDIKATPDLMPALAVLSAGTGVALTLKGTAHLRYKESDRIEAMSTELGKGGVCFEVEKDHLSITGRFEAGGKAVFDTWKDHRIAMSLACLSFLENIRIREPQVVSKSFPGYWEAFRNMH